jgi:hypothetical protein
MPSPQGKVQRLGCLRAADRPHVSKQWNRPIVGNRQHGVQPLAQRRPLPCSLGRDVALGGGRPAQEMGLPIVVEILEHDRHHDRLHCHILQTGSRKEGRQRLRLAKRTVQARVLRGCCRIERGRAHQKYRVNCRSPVKSQT